MFLHRPEYDHCFTEGGSTARQPLSVRTVLGDLFDACIYENEIGLMFRGQFRLPGNRFGNGANGYELHRTVPSTRQQGTAEVLE